MVKKESNVVKIRKEKRERGEKGKGWKGEEKKKNETCGLVEEKRGKEGK